jgi:hypothetical protein
LLAPKISDGIGKAMRTKIFEATLPSDAFERLLLEERENFIAQERRGWPASTALEVQI